MRAWFNRMRRRLVRWLLFRLVFGEQSAGRWLPGTRISPSTCIEFEDRLTLGDDVFIGHFCWVEASGGVHIGAGTHVTNYVSIVTHSTHRSVRLGSEAEQGVVRGAVHIGQRCFIGPHSTIEAGSRLGHGCVVASHSRVRGVFADFSLIGGSPAQVLGDVRAADERWLAVHPEAQAAHAAYTAWRKGLPQGAQGAE